MLNKTEVIQAAAQDCRCQESGRKGDINREEACTGRPMAIIACRVTSRDQAQCHSALSNTQRVILHETMRSTV